VREPAFTETVQIGIVVRDLEATMQRYVDDFQTVPVLILPCLIRYRAANPLEGASVFPACQNILLAARALGYGGVTTGWHSGVEA